MDAILIRLQKEQKEGNSGVLCIVTQTSGSTPRKAGAKMLVLPNGSTIGSIGGGAIEYKVVKHALDVLQNRHPHMMSFLLEEDLAMQCGGDMTVYFEPFGQMPALHIFGAGHVGKALANMARPFGFVIHIIDPRDGIFDDLKDDAFVFHKGQYVETIPELKLTTSSFVVIATPEHVSDEAVLENLIKLTLKYLGMLGSKRKVAGVRERLMAKTQVIKEDIDKVHMPIGLPMKCETPEDIALSILAQLIDKKNNPD
jgi:xanthine dehydrogenase accessory factor